MRRLLLLASAVVFVDTMFFAAVVPLLPGLSTEFGLSKTGAGVLSGSYAAGTLVAAIPGGILAARIGARTTVLAGLGLMTATSVVFAMAGGVVLLDGARFVQGIGGALSWAGALGWLIGAAPRERRGELIGSAMAAAIAGVLVGPALGAVADALGRGPTFSAVAFAGIGLIWATLRTPAPVRSATGAEPGRLAMASRSPAVRFGMLLILVPGMLFGAVDVLVPLELAELGAGAGAIAAVFLGAAALEAVSAPLAGRLSDRRGRLMPSVAGLAGSAVFMLLLALPDRAWLLGLTLILAAPAIGMLWSPAMAMLADGAEARGVDQGLAFGFVNLGWGLGHTTGAIAGPALGEAASDAAAYVTLAVICAVTLVALLRRAPALVTG